LDKYLRGDKGTGEAVTVAENKSTETTDLEVINRILVELESGRIGLHVTQNVLLGLIAAFAGGTSAGDDINEIVSALDLGLTIDAGIQVSPELKLEVNIDSKILSVGLTLDSLAIETGVGGETYNHVEEELATAIAEGNFQERPTSGIITVDLNVLIDYETSATYILLEDQNRLATYAAKDRYSRNKSDGRFVQDPNGKYVRDGFAFDDTIGFILGLPSISDFLSSYTLPVIHFVGGENGKVTLADLLSHLGLNLMLNDAMKDGILIGIQLRVDTEALGLDLNKISAGDIDFKNINFDINAILKALEASITIDFTYEEGASSQHKIALYLIEGDLYLDMSAIGGPKLSVGFMDLLDKFGVNDPKQEAVTVAKGNDSVLENIGKALNVMVKGIVVSGSPWGVGSEAYNKLQELGLYFRPDMINSLLNMFVPALGAESILTLLNDESGLFIKPDYTVAGRDMLALDLVMGFANKKSAGYVENEDGTVKEANVDFNIDLTLGLNFNFDFISTDDYAGILSRSERYQYINLDLYIENLLPIIFGFYRDTDVYDSVAAEDIVEDVAYGYFEQNDEGEYVEVKAEYIKKNGKDVQISGEYRLIKKGEENLIASGNRYALKDNLVMHGGKALYFEFEEDENGKYVYDENAGAYREIKQDEKVEGKRYKLNTTPADANQLFYSATAVLKDAYARVDAADIDQLGAIYYAFTNTELTRYEFTNKDGNTEAFYSFTNPVVDGDNNNYVGNAGNYVKHGGMFREIGESDDKLDVSERFIRHFVTVKDGKVYIVEYEPKAGGDYVYDLESGLYVAATASDNGTHYARKDTLLANAKVEGTGANAKVVGCEAVALSKVGIYEIVGRPVYRDQNIYLSVGGLVYLNSSGIESYNLGGLVSNLLGDMLIELQAQSEFTSGVGIRVALNLDLAKLDLVGLVNGMPIDQFILNSDLEDIELAIEFTKVDANGRHDKYPSGEIKVLGGLYLSGGSLYIDATEIIS
ncbi:MAG: hypothetical protein K2N18_02875, partial [Clostridia bacterium]|nr:hypothetical protein [Clostridia bacterium]